MGKLNNKDINLVSEQFSMQYTEQDLQEHSGIKIKNSNTQCYLKRIDDNGLSYWVKCERLSNNRIKEIEVVSIETLLNRLNSDIKNYILVLKG